MKSWILLICTLCVLNTYAFEIRSNDMQEGKPLAPEQVLNGFGCSGKNVSPHVAWRNPPQGTRSFAITLFDQDAPTGSGWWHWTVFNITAKEDSLSKNAGATQGNLLPKGAIQGRTDFGKPGFGGVCPPVGDKPHRYQLTVWALDIEKLPLDDQASGALVGFMLNAHSLGQARLTAIHGR